MLNDREVKAPVFPGANTKGKKLFIVDSRTRVYVNENATEKELEQIRQKYDSMKPMNLNSIRIGQI